MNYVADVPPGPVPQTPKITTVTPGDTTATVEWQYPANVVDVDHWDLTVYQAAAEVGMVRVEGPDTRKAILGELVNGTTYSVVVQGVNLNGRSEPSNRVDFTPKSAAIPAPSIYSITPGDGFISFSFRDGSPLPGPVEGHRYIAKRTDSGYETEGDVIPMGESTILGTTGPIDNDREYVLLLATVIGGKVGPYSEPSKPVTPTNPVPPYPPVWAHVDANKWDRTSTGQGKGVDWLLTIGAGVKNTQGDIGPLNITGYRYSIVEKATGKTIIERSMPSSQSQISVSDTGPWMDGIAIMSCWAKNNDGESQPTVIEFDTDPHDELPIDFGVWQEFDGYRYHIAEDDVTKYAKVNKRGIGVPLDILVIGAGGGGQGRTTLGAYGGAGGSGAVSVYTGYKNFNTGSITTIIGTGAKYSATGPGGYSYVQMESQQWKADGGGTANGKNDGTPSWTTPSQQVDFYMSGASKLRVWMWNVPYSSSVGGAREWNKSDAPDANLYGQGGGGTNSSGSNRGGNGGPGIAVIRYKISDVPPADPPMGRRARWRHRRFERKFARQVRKADFHFDSLD